MNPKPNKLRMHKLRNPNQKRKEDLQIWTLQISRNSNNYWNVARENAKPRTVMYSKQTKFL